MAYDGISRRSFLKRCAAVSVAAPMFVSSRAFGANDRIVMGFIGMGGQGRGDLEGFLGFNEVQAVAVCDVVDDHANMAKKMVDDRYRNRDCKVCRDFRDIIAREDVDAIFIATPDHWHAIIAIEAMKSGKDVYCEKPETLTIREGREIATIARRYGRVFSGGSQRVWEDYNWFHKMIYGGRLGEMQEVWVNVGGPSGFCDLPPQPVPPGVDWDMWLGPAPWRPYHEGLTKGNFRPYSDYSGGGTTDWGCHGFGGAMFACNVHRTGPVQVIPPDGKDVKNLTFVFENGLRMYHGGGWGGLLTFKGTQGEIGDNGDRKGRKDIPPMINIPNYKGRGGIAGDFLHCVRTREEPFRNIEVAHRTATVAHMGNIAYRLKRPLKWDHVKEEFVGDPEANRFLDRSRRAPWRL
ncbi:MAG TPA: Gfo/Idh/MocA family oxidoreductase [Candidatus Brocadiia bacterium]|nr:Gfo/Idh/MocA family oxidoreductase [Candidatus Brocadiia bacterium]